MNQYCRRGLLDQDIHRVLTSDYGETPPFPAPSRKAQRIRAELRQEGGTSLSITIKDGQVTVNASGDQTTTRETMESYRDFLVHELAEERSISLEEAESLIPAPAIGEPFSDGVALNRYYRAGATSMDRFIHVLACDWHERMSDLLTAAGVQTSANAFETFRDLARYLEFLPEDADTTLYLPGHELPPHSYGRHLPLYFAFLIAPWTYPGVWSPPRSLQLSERTAFALASSGDGLYEHSWPLLMSAPFFVDIARAGADRSQITGVGSFPFEDSLVVFAVVESKGGIDAFLSMQVDSEWRPVSNAWNKLIALPRRDCLAAASDESRRVDEILSAHSNELRERVLQTLSLVCVYDRYADTAVRASLDRSPVERQRPSADFVRDPEATDRPDAQSASLFSFMRISGNSETERAGSESSGATWALTHRVSVRGHLRLQPCGTGRADRKLIWIEAHERGAGADTAPNPRPTMIVADEDSSEGARP